MIQIVPAPEQRREELYDLAAKVFSHNGYFEFLRYCRDSYFTGSSYDWATSRVALADGKIVGHVGVWEYRMRVGTARLRTGGIGAVMTHGDYRKRGIAASLMRAVMASMRRAGYHYSVLFGIRDFYHRFGFAQAWPDTRHFVDASALPAEPLALTLRKAPLTDALCGVGAIMGLYNRENATRTGTAERPIYTRTKEKVLCHALLAGRRPCGYVVTKTVNDDLLVLEAQGYARPCGAGQLLAALAVLARREKRARLCFENFPYDHPMCRVLRLGDCRVEMRHSRNGSAMGAVVSLAGALKAMEGELSRRLVASRLGGLAGRLAIAGEGETVELAIGRGRVRIAAGRGRPAGRIAAGPAAARLLLGSAGPSELAGRGQVRFTGSAGELAEALFPAQWPSLYSLDRF